MTLDSPPAWLADSPEMLALLNTALDRFDRQSGESRTRLLLSTEQHLPALARNDVAADELWRLVGELEKCGVLAIRRARVGPYDAPWQGAKFAFAPQAEGTLRAWLDRSPASAALERWRSLVRAKAHLFPTVCEPLLARRIVIGNRSDEEILDAFAGIAALRGPMTLRQLSARAFWGDSKVLDDRAELIASLFPDLEVRDRAIIVAVHLPEHVRGVLFIENQDTYVAACEGIPQQLHELALVYASGFRASATRIRSQGGACLHFAGPGCAHYARSLDAWWFGEGEPLGALGFWGDLDFAGMQILKSLRDRFGEVSAWRPGYEPMLQALRSRGGYRSTRVEIGQRDPQFTGCSYADSVLLPAIREYGCRDQEGGTFP